MVYGSDWFSYDFRGAIGGKLAPAPSITVDALKRHIKRFGSDCVEQTARQAGLSDAQLLELGFGGSTEARVLALHDQGYVAAEIEKRLNLTRPFVRRIISKTAGEAA
jgi:hypothetical protein